MSAMNGNYTGHDRGASTKELELRCQPVLKMFVFSLRDQILFADDSAPTTELGL